MPAKPFVLADAGLARLSHVSLQVREIEPALDFYRTIFGMQVILDQTLEGADFEAVTATPGARSRMIRGLIAGQAVVQLFWHSWREATETHQTLMSFEVRDAAAAHRLLEGEGVACQSPPVEFDNSWAFVLHDLDGHPIEIIQWKPDFQPYRAS